MSVSLRNLFALLLVTAAQLTAAATPAAPVVLQDLNNPVGLRALESFAGPDRLGKDGVMGALVLT